MVTGSAYGVGGSVRLVWTVGRLLWAFDFHSTPRRASVVTLRCKDRLVNLARGRGAYRTVKRCAIGWARRFTQRGIDPGFIHLERKNPPFEVGRLAGLDELPRRLSAYLIRRRLCTSCLEGLRAHPDGLLLAPEPWPLTLAPGGRLVLRSGGVGGSPSAANANISTLHSGTSSPPTSINPPSSTRAVMPPCPRTAL